MPHRMTAEEHALAAAQERHEFVLRNFTDAAARERHWADVRKACGRDLHEARRALAHFTINEDGTVTRHEQPSYDLRSISVSADA